MTKVTFVSSDGARTTVDTSDGSSVMQTALDNAIDGIQAECGGAMACATCHVYIDDNQMEKLEAVEADEYDLLSMSGHRQPNSRLSCQIEFSDALDGLKVTIAKAE